MLEELFFNSDVARVIEHFLIHEKWEQNQKDLCEILNIYQEGMKKILEKLLEVGFLKITRKIAKSKFYMINNESTLIIPLRKLSHEFTYQESLKFAQIELNKENNQENEKNEG